MRQDIAKILGQAGEKDAIRIEYLAAISQTQSQADDIAQDVERDTAQNYGFSGLK